MWKKKVDLKTKYAVILTFIFTYGVTFTGDLYIFVQLSQLLSNVILLEPIEFFLTNYFLQGGPTGN